MTPIPPAQFDDTRVVFDDTRVDFDGNWTEGDPPPPPGEPGDPGILRPPSYGVAQVHVDPRGSLERLSNRLARYFTPHTAEKNVYLLTTGAATTREPRESSLVAKVFHGGRLNTVSGAERTLLEAAGFTVDDI